MMAHACNSNAWKGQVGRLSARPLWAPKGDPVSNRDKLEMQIHDNMFYKDPQDSRFNPQPSKRPDKWP